MLSKKTGFVPPVPIEAALEQTVDCFVASLLAIQREAHSMSDAAICCAAGAHQLLLIGCIPSKVADLYLDLAKTS